MTNPGLSPNKGEEESPFSLNEKGDSEPHNTETELASELGWSKGKTAMADKVWKDAPVIPNIYIDIYNVTITNARQ